jgi:PhnB protein
MKIVDNYKLQPIPYLAFNGNCAEALDFYSALFGGKIIGKMTFGEMPGDMPIPDEAKSGVVNEMLELPGGAMLYGGDTPPGMTYSPMAGLSLALNFPTVEQAQKVFDGLAAGGEIKMPFAPTFWAEKFGMVTDKYGVHWAVNGNLGMR